MARTDKEIALVGAGYTALSRTPQRSEVGLGIEACRNAIEDAGLTPAEVDGINIQVHHYPPPDTGAIVAGLGMKPPGWSAEGGLGAAALGRAAEVIDAGLCHTIVVCKIMNTIAPVTTPAIDPETGAVSGPGQFEVPFGLGYTMQRVGFLKRRWMDRFSITDEQVGWLCVTERQHALLNPVAYFNQPLTIDDYCASRWVADPVRLLDCDYPVNGAFAYIVTREERARDLRQPSVRLLSWVDGIGDDIPHLRPELADGLSPLAVELYRDCGVAPGDLDVWMLYDGFSFLAMQWMEHLGLVPPGQSGAYVEGGQRILHTGEHPVNTHGGQLSEGRMHATGHILEAIQQVRGTAGARQANKADYAVITSAYPYNGAAAILGRS